MLFLLGLSDIYAETLIRIRFMQPSPLIFESAEKGVIKSDSTEIPLNTSLTDSGSFLASYGIFGIGTSFISTSFSYSKLNYELKSSWWDLAFVLDSLTFGYGILNEGEGNISFDNSVMIGEKVNGEAFFATLGIEYTLPFKIDLLGTKFIEILFGYRENNLEYSDFQHQSFSTKNDLKFKSIQYQFGVGLVF